MTSLAVSYQVAGDAYQTQAVGTAGPLQLVLMLYDRALAAIARSEWALKNREPGSIEVAHKELTRAQDIVTELLLSLVPQPPSSSVPAYRTAILRRHLRKNGMGGRSSRL
jgi:flagellar biosynthetic protein FliS